MIGAAAVLIAGTLAIWLWLSARYIQRPTQGVRIEPRPGTALLIVDLQEVFWNDAHYDTATRARVEAALAREAALAQDRGDPVIALRQEWSTPGTRLLARLLMKGEALRGSPGTALAAPFQGLADHVVVKRVQDGFETGELDVVLRVLGIGRLKIAGLDGVHCVAKTAQGALNRGYDVDLIRDAIATRDPAVFETVEEALSGQGVRLV